MAGEPVPECQVCHQPLEFFFEMSVASGANQVYKCRQCKITRLVRPAVSPASGGLKPPPRTSGHGQA